MKAIAINGSPRKKWNTATLLENALSGCSANGAETELVHLYDHTYRGCISCFECKRIGGKSYGRCAVSDGLSPVLDRAAQADVLILGSPLYFHTETGEMRSVMERLLFPYLTYTPSRASLYPRKIPTALVYAIGVTEENMPAMHQDASASVDDYSKFLSTAFDADAKARRRRDVFPRDCQRAYELGARLVSMAR